MTKKELRIWVNKKLKEYGFLRPPYNKNGDWIWDLEVWTMWKNYKEYSQDTHFEVNAIPFYKSMWKNDRFHKSFWEYIEDKEPEYFVKGAVWDFALERAETGEIGEYLTLELGIGVLSDSLTNKKGD
tara:strand:- start:1116 stop:1496 length:381 start_codon:yes stop_codon:yes gene_type:complete